MLSRLNSAVLQATCVGTGALVAALVVLVGANVFARYVLSAGILWSEELSRLLFVWIVLLGAYIALCRGSHMAVVLVVDSVTPGIRRVLVLAGLLLVLAFLATIGYAGARLVWTTFAFGRQTPIIGVSAAWGYLSVPVAFSLMSLRVVEDTLAIVRGRAADHFIRQ